MVVENAGEALQVAEAQKTIQKGAAIGCGGCAVPRQHNPEKQKQHRQQVDRSGPALPVASPGEEDPDHQGRQQHAHGPLGQHGDAAEQGQGDTAQGFPESMAGQPMADQKAEERQADGTGQKHVRGGGPPPADPARGGGKHPRRHAGADQPGAGCFLGRSPQIDQATGRHHGGCCGQGYRQARRPFRRPEPAEALGHHPIAPDGVIEEDLAVPPGGHPIVSQHHLVGDFDEQGLGLVHQPQAAEAIEKSQPAEA